MSMSTGNGAKKSPEELVEVSLSITVGLKTGNLREAMSFVFELHRFCRERHGAVLSWDCDYRDSSEEEIIDAEYRAE